MAKVKSNAIGKLEDGTEDNRAYNALVRQYGVAFKELYDNFPREPKPRLGLYMMSIKRPEGVLRLTPGVVGSSSDGIQKRVQAHLGKCLDQIGLDDLCMDVFTVSCNSTSSVCEITPYTLEARAYLKHYGQQILVPEMRRLRSQSK